MTEHSVVGTLLELQSQRLSKLQHTVDRQETDVAVIRENLERVRRSIDSTNSRLDGITKRLDRITFYLEGGNK